MMDDQSSSKGAGMRFLSFANDKEDAEKASKLKEAALRIEQAIERQKSVSQLIDYKPPPEEEIDLANDTRPLYERLLEQRNKKQEAHEESHKLSNLVTKLDEDEANYFNGLAKSKQEEEIKKRLEIYDVLEEKKRNSERKILEDEKILKQSFLGLKTQPSTANSLKSKLASIIKVKPRTNKEATSMVSKDHKPARDTAPHGNGGRPVHDQTVKRQSTHDSSESGHSSGNNHHSDPKRLKKNEPQDPDRNKDDEITHIDQPHCNCAHQNDLMRCIGVMPSLPLVEKFPDSSDSDNSDDNFNPRIVPRIGGSNK